MLRLLAKRNFTTAFFLCLTFCWASHSNGQVLKWERISSAKLDTTEIEKHFQKEFSDPAFNLGSQTSPAPRTELSGLQDAQGNVWIFSGMGIDAKGNFGLFSDLWKYEPASGTWRLLNGTGEVVSNNQNSDKTPSPRRKALTWVDNEGNFWVMGGHSQGDNEYFSDLWKFNAASNSWQQLRPGNQLNLAANWGQQKKENASNTPGSRSGSITWTDPKGDLWLFGGKTGNYSKGQLEYYNDLWKFDIKKESWTWESGKNQVNGKSSFGKKKTEGDVQAPSPRYGASRWIDKNGNKLWVYGGAGLDTASALTGGLGDLWSFNTNSEKWTWESGSQYLNGKNDDLAKEKEQFSAIWPGYRYSSFVWENNKGELCLFAGQNTINGGNYDLDPSVWAYSVKTGLWKFYLSSNNPGLADGGISFKDSEGNLMIFGGRKFNPKTLKFYPTNELWKIVIR